MSVHVCSVRTARCAAFNDDGEFIDYNGARTTVDGRASCAPCRDLTDHNGADAVTRLELPGLAGWFAAHGEAAPRW